MGPNETITAERAAHLLRQGAAVATWNTDPALSFEGSTVGAGWVGTYERDIVKACETR